MQRVFGITNRYIILATVLILYSLISNVYAAFFAVGGAAKPAGLIFAVILLILMSAVFMAGWFKMVKTAVLEPDKEDTNSLIKIFPEGVGEYILPILGLLVVLVILWGIIGTAVFYFGIHHIGNPNVDFAKFAKVSGDTAAAKAFFMALSAEQIAKLAKWNHLFILAVLCSYLLTFLYLPALFFKNSNPFVAFFISLKNLFSKKILKTTGLFLLIFFANTVISVLSVVFNSNALLEFICTLAAFYILTASAVGLFKYYNDNFTESHLGQNIDIEV